MTTDIPTIVSDQNPTDRIINNFPNGSKSTTRKLILTLGVVILVIGTFSATYTYENSKLVNQRNQDKAQINQLQRQILSLNQQLANKKVLLSASSSRKYLDITQLGIKLPLSNTINDLSYIWNSSGNYASLYSKNLADFDIKQAPECASSVNVVKGELLGTINITVPTNHSGLIELINGKSYTFFTPQFGYGCGSITAQQDNLIGQQVINYTTALEAAFKAASVIN